MKHVTCEVTDGGPGPGVEVTTQRTPSGSKSATSLFLLRHGQVGSHRGDVPLTGEGGHTSAKAGAWLADVVRGPVEVLYGSTLRARQTALFVAGALASTAPRLVVGEPRVSFALRNPDLYLGGERVDMVSSADALADQVPGLGPEQCAAHPWFGRFMQSPERVGWWLRHPRPPGDDAGTVARRIIAFTRSLADRPVPHGDVIGITHSPVLRSVGVALLDEDPGELGHLTGYHLMITEEDSVSAIRFEPG